MALLVAATLIMIGWMPIMLRAEGWAFLPSMPWVERSYWPAMASAAICAIVPSLIAIRSRTRDRGSRKSIKYLLFLAFAPVLLGSLGFHAVSAGGPMLYTWAAGKPAELPFVIERAKRSENWKCRNPIQLRDLPPLTSKLCGLSDDLIDQLRPGQTIIVAGRASVLGVFAKSARMADQP